MLMDVHWFLSEFLWIFFGFDKLRCVISEGDRFEYTGRNASIRWQFSIASELPEGNLRTNI